MQPTKNLVTLYKKCEKMKSRNTVAVVFTYILILPSLVTSFFIGGFWVMITIISIFIAIAASSSIKRVFSELSLMQPQEATKTLSSFVMYTVILVIYSILLMALTEGFLLMPALGIFIPALINWVASATMKDLIVKLTTEEIEQLQYVYSYHIPRQNYQQHAAQFQQNMQQPYIQQPQQPPVSPHSQPEQPVPVTAETLDANINEKISEVTQTEVATAEPTPEVNAASLDIPASYQNEQPIVETDEPVEVVENVEPPRAPWQRPKIYVRGKH